MTKWTDERIRKFWELCGFKVRHSVGDWKRKHYGISEVNLKYPIRPDGVRLESFPSIHDLNALFKWGVPVALKHYCSKFNLNKEQAKTMLFAMWWENWNKQDNPALALAEAIWKALEGT